MTAAGGRKTQRREALKTGALARLMARPTLAVRFDAERLSPDERDMAVLHLWDRGRLGPVWPLWARARIPALINRGWMRVGLEGEPVWCFEAAVALADLEGRDAPYRPPGDGSCRCGICQADGAGGHGMGRLFGGGA